VLVETDGAISASLINIADISARAGGANPTNCRYSSMLKDTSGGNDLRRPNKESRNRCSKSDAKEEEKDSADDGKWYNTWPVMRFAMAGDAVASQHVNYTRDSNNCTCLIS
jgi:hypothetical protein